MTRFFGFIIPGFLLLTCTGEAPPPTQFLSHNLEISFRLDTHRAKIRDTGRIVLQPGLNQWTVPAGLTQPQLEFNGQEIPANLLAPDSGADTRILQFSTSLTGEQEFVLQYTAEFHADVSNVHFSNQKVGREVTGTVLERGIYLSPAAAYYPQADADGLMQFRVTALLPAGFTLIADGNPVEESEPGRWTYENPFLSDGLMFMAAPYVVKTLSEDGLTAACAFFAEDTSLFETYLPASLDYLKMYTGLIGPYPYDRFTVVENFFPTGYGMPGWTLLGQDVLRLPFIVMTSLGHEVLHNWWGNSVYVDYSRGNWCEGLTVYGADYRFKEMRSAAAARDYRKDILKQYRSYVNAENDFPLRKFTSRSENFERTIGYNKAMMVFHMIRRAIGEGPFWQAWKTVNERYREKQISWEEWVDTFAELSGKDLQHVIPEWIERTGAVTLALDSVEMVYDGREKRSTVSFVLSQPEDHWYHLQVPVTLFGNRNHERSVRMDSPRQRFELEIKGTAGAMEVDPDYQIFRNLYPEEVEPILAMILGSGDFHFNTPESDPGVRERFTRFGKNLTETDVELEEQSIVTAMEGNFALVLLNPVNLPPSLRDLVQMEDDQVVIKGEAHPREGFSYVLTTGEPDLDGHILVVLTTDFESLPRIGELLPHYGKYSFLGFKGSRNMLKGQWPTQGSPLHVDFQDGQR